MTNRERAIELLKEIAEICWINSEKSVSSLMIDSLAIVAVTRALSEPRPYFDGEYYHLSLLQLDLAEKFINRNVIFYDYPWDFENESILNAALIGAYKDGFEMQERDGNTYHFPYIAIQKSDYERVMGEA